MPRNRGDHQRERRREQGEKKSELREKEKKRKRRRMIESMMESEELDAIARLNIELDTYQELYEEFMLKIDHIEYGVRTHEFQINYWEDWLQDWTEEHTEHSWISAMRIIEEHEDRKSGMIYISMYKFWRERLMQIT